MPRKKDDTKNVSVVKEQAAVGKIPDYTPSETELKVVSSTFSKFRETQQHRDQPLENFDGLKLVDYINESVRRFITNVDEREDLEDWQARVHDPFTRNKTLTVLSKIVQVLPIAEFSGRGEEDFRKGQIVTDLYQYSEDLDDYEELMINILLEAITKGTAVAYEGHEQKSQKIRNVSGVGDDMTVSEGTRTTNRLYGTLVPLEDFYPSSIGVRKIKEMPYCFWRSIIPFQQFKQDFAKWSRTSLVRPKVTVMSGENEERPYYLNYVSTDVQDGNVEVIRYYNKDVDEYVLVANGVWLNPIKSKENETISPLPFTHKELPFWDVRFELFINCFYGKSLPDKLKSLQDVLNVLTNMLLDQSFLTIFPPMLTAGVDDIEDDYLRPGRRTPVDTQGGSLKDSYMILEQPTPQGWHQFILQYTRKVMEEASVDQVSSGQAGVGGRTTAQEIQTAAAGVTAMIGLFGRLIKYGIKRKALLRAKNILQFWTNQNSPMIEQVLGQGGAAEANKAFNTFKVNNTVLSNGKRGTKIIEMYGKTEDMPTKKQAEARAMLSKLDSNRNVEIVSVLPDYIRDFEFDIKLAVNTKAEETKEMEKAIQLEKVRIYKSFFPNIINDAELAADTMMKMGDDPSKLLLPEVVENALMTEEQKKAAAKAESPALSTDPQGTLANQAMEGAMGKQLFDQNLNSLRSQMTG